MSYLETLSKVSETHTAEDIAVDAHGSADRELFASARNDIGNYQGDATRAAAAYEQVNDKKKAHFSHELIAGAAGFAAMKAFEDHNKKEGKEVKHKFAKEMLAGLAMAGAVKLVEEKIPNATAEHKRKAAAEAAAHAQSAYDAKYGA